MTVSYTHLDDSYQGGPGSDLINLCKYPKGLSLFSTWKTETENKNGGITDVRF